MNLGETIKLTEEVKHADCLLVLDNYFIPFRVTKNLLANGLFSVGTMRPQKKDVPQI